jgi:hypothetical protein
MALNVVQYEEIVSLLRQLPSLTDKLEARSTGFPDDVLAWLKQAETTLENNRVPAVSQISALRAMLIEAGRGVRNKEVTFVGRPTNRKVREGTASMALQRSNAVLQDVIAERRTVFEEAERLSRQVLAVSEAKGFVQACDDGRPHDEFLDCLREHVAADADLASVYVHLVSLVGATDVLIFLDRARASVS